MKKTIFITVLSLLIASCAPSRYAIHVEMRHPSKSGIDLNGKIVAMVCAEDSSALRTQVIEGIAEGLPRHLNRTTRPVREVLLYAG